MTQNDNEVCAKCGFLFKNHISNTGCVYPCWTPSGRYSDKNELPPAEDLWYVHVD